MSFLGLLWAPVSPLEPHRPRTTMKFTDLEKTTLQSTKTESLLTIDGVVLSLCGIKVCSGRYCTKLVCMHQSAIRKYTLTVSRSYKKRKRIKMQRITFSLYDCDVLVGKPIFQLAKRNNQLCFSLEVLVLVCEELIWSANDAITPYRVVQVRLIVAEPHRSLFLQDNRWPEWLFRHWLTK